jgi:iron complex outermembrane receptor protein
VKLFLNKCTIIVLFQFGILTNLFTQVDADSNNYSMDSISIQIDHKEYEIFEYSAYDFTAGIRTVQISPTLINNNSSLSNLSDALQSIGGIYMRSYGNAMNNAITLRGFGPERTSILWNGISLNNAGLGQLDMNLMPGGFFNNIQLIEGSSSTQYGNGAQGGSLLLEFKPNFNNRFNIQLQQEFGSFFTWNTSAQLNYGNKWIQGRSAFIRNSSDNNYAYKDKSTIGFPIRETVNANFFSYQGMQDIFFKLKKNWHLSMHGWYTYTDRKIPPAMGATNNHSQQFDQNLRFMTQLRKSFEKHDIQIQLAYINDQLIYHTDAFKDSSSIHTGQAQIQYIYHPKKIFTLMTGGNFSLNYSEYKYYAVPVTELRGNVFVLANFHINQNSWSRARSIKISVGIRQQFSTHYTAYPSAHAGIDYSLNKGKFRFYTSGGVNTAYRMPTLNDLYWVPGGNTNLKPEYSWNVEHSYKFEFGRPHETVFTFDVLGYYGRTSNWIQWAPTALGYWTPQNITHVQSAGFESGASLSLKSQPEKKNWKKWNVHIQSKYNFTHTTDINDHFNQLIYVPQHSIKGQVEIKWNELYVNIQPVFYSKRFTLSDNTQSIPATFLLNLQAGYKLQLASCSVGFYGRLGNLTNADYQMILNRPMPGINFNLGINFYLHTKTTKQ